MTYDIVEIAQLVKTVSDGIAALDNLATHKQIEELEQRHQDSRCDLDMEITRIKTDQSESLKQLGVKVRSMLLEDGLEEAKLGLKPSKKYAPSRIQLEDVAPAVDDSTLDWLDDD
jgi:hypothetical protein